VIELSNVHFFIKMTIAIGDEIRESSALAEKMNDSFDKTAITRDNEQDAAYGRKDRRGLEGLVSFLCCRRFAVLLRLGLLGTSYRVDICNQLFLSISW
jgi:hypothetical protein